MNIFDKFFTKFSYKFDKGYPSMDDPNDIALLESLISKTIGEKFSLKEATDAELGIEILQKEFGNHILASDLISVLPKVLNSLDN